LSGDELAGVVDLFGALTREQLRQAVEEVAFRVGDERDDADVSAAIDEALEEYRLVACDPEEAGAPTGDEELLVAGPTAFPTIPEGGQDLPLIMDVERRSVDREAVGRAVQRRFRAETARAVEAGDLERAETLLDVSYDVETWAPVDLADVRTRLDDALEDRTDRASDEGVEP